MCLSEYNEKLTFQTPPRKKTGAKSLHLADERIELGIELLDALKLCPRCNGLFSAKPARENLPESANHSLIPQVMAH